MLQRWTPRFSGRSMWARSRMTVEVRFTGYAATLLLPFVSWKPRLFDRAQDIAFGSAAHHRQSRAPRPRGQEGPKRPSPRSSAPLTFPGAPCCPPGKHCAPREGAKPRTSNNVEAEQGLESLALVYSPASDPCQGRAEGESSPVAAKGSTWTGWASDAVSF